MPARNGWVGLHVAYSGTEAGALTRGRTGETVEHHVVVCAMDLVVHRAVGHAAHAPSAESSACIQRARPCRTVEQQSQWARQRGHVRRGRGRNGEEAPSRWARHRCPRPLNAARADTLSV